MTTSPPTTNSQQQQQKASASFSLSSDAIDLMPAAQSSDTKPPQSPSRVSNTLEHQMQVNQDPA